MCLASGRAALGHPADTDFATGSAAGCSELVFRQQGRLPAHSHRPTDPNDAEEHLPARLLRLFLTAANRIMAAVKNGLVVVCQGRVRGLIRWGQLAIVGNPTVAKRPIVIDIQKRAI